MKMNDDAMVYTVYHSLKSLPARYTCVQRNYLMAHLGKSCSDRRPETF